MTPTFQITSLHSSVSSTCCSKPDLHMKRPSDTSSIPSPHTWWDESQLDLDLADDSITAPEEQLNRKQRLKQKLMTTMKHHPNHHQHHQRSSWLSNSSSNSSLSSQHSLTTPSLNQATSSSYSKLSRPFIQLKHLLKKH